MDEYKTIIKEDKMITSYKFYYDFRNDTFKLLDNSNKSFRNLIKSKLESYFLSLANEQKEFEFETSYYLSDFGLRFYKISGNNYEDINVIKGVIIDVTDEKDLLEKMTHAEMLRTLGELSGGIAHDFNNQLMIILGSSEMLELGTLSEKQKDYLINIKRSALSSAELIKKILSFSRGVDSSNVNLDLVKIIKEAKEIMSYTTKKDIEIIFNTKLDSAFIIGNKSSIENAIINLIKNGIEASIGEARIIINLDLVEILSPLDNSIIKSDLIGYFYKLEIIDFGCGISDDIKDKIFNPFFSTKENNKGVGLGLSTIINTIISYHGYLTLESEVLKGSKFTLFLPKN